jgi:hypothetical protein
MSRSLFLLVFLCLVSTVIPAAAEECEGLVTVPDNRFTAHPDGTVSDRATGLMWKQCVEGLSGFGCAVGEPLQFSWKWAVSQGKSDTFAGYSDWRLPEKTELLTLVMYRCYGIDTDVVNFPNTPADRFWTATPTAYYPGSAWTIHFGNGSAGYGTKRDSALVRLVRDAAACSPVNPGSCGSQYRGLRVPTPQPWSPSLRGPLTP